MIRIKNAGVIVALAVFYAGLNAAAQEAPKPESNDKAKGGLPLSVRYKDALWLESDDGAFQAAINGRVTAHYRSILDRPEDVPASAGASRTQPNGLFLRTARFDVAGLFRKQFEFKLQMDFPTGTQSNTGTPPSSTTGTLQDAFVGWRPSVDFGVRVGQFKEPFSQDQTASLRTIEFNERSILDRLVPARDLGILVHGKPLGGLLEYEVGGFNGGGRAVVDNNDEKEIAGRVRVWPFQGFRLGVSGTFGDLDAASTAATTGDPLDLTSTELNVKFLDVGGAAVVDGRRTRVGLELAWAWAFLGFRTEWARRTDTLVTATGTNRIPMSAYNVSVTALLTGETKAVEERIVPLNPFDAEGGWGAVELAARFAALRADDDVLALTAAGSGANANAIRTVTVGANWYVTRNVRISPDFILERTNRRITFADGKTEDTFRGFLIRFQVDF